MPEKDPSQRRLSEGQPPGSGFVEQTDLVRRRRYSRVPTQAACVSLTPVRVEILRFLAELRFLSLPQIAKLCCPSERQDLAEKSARRHMRALFDAGLVDVLPVSRAALAPPGTPNDASLLYGSAPNVYALTARGLEILHRAGLTDRQVDGRKIPAYGPKNSLFLAHELAIRDVRVWLETKDRASGGRQYVLRWQDGPEATLEARTVCTVRPDAWFIYRLGEQQGREAVLVGLVEVDRGTERGGKRWQEKLAAYAMLFATGAVKNVTGYANARVLVITPNTERRDQLAQFVTKNSGPAAARFWVASREAFARAELASPIWRRGGESQALLPLLAPTALAPSL